MVKFKPLSFEQANAIIEEEGASIRQDFPVVPEQRTYSVKVSRGKELQKIKDFLKHPEVIEAYHDSCGATN